MPLGRFTAAPAASSVHRVGYGAQALRFATLAVMLASMLIATLLTAAVVNHVQAKQGLATLDACAETVCD